MPINGMTGYIGGVSVTPVSGSLRAKKWVVLQHYNDLAIRNTRNVSCVVSKHRTKHNLTCYSWTVI